MRLPQIPRALGALGAGAFLAGALVYAQPVAAPARPAPAYDPLPEASGVGCGPADAGRLTPQEVRLWREHGLGVPAGHLLRQASERKAGGTTLLRLVAILVDFPDYPADYELHPPQYYEDLLFSRGVLPGGSVAEYFDASSHGRLRLEGVVRGWITVSGYRNSYTAGTSGIGGYPANAQRLAEEAIVLADPTVNYADYDSEGPDEVPDSGDDDEIIDGLVLVHAGTGRGEGGTTPNDFTAVHWWTPDPVPVDGVFGRFFTLNPENGEIGIFIHELGHLLGLPDLYDTDGGSAGVGWWSMMAGGWIMDGGRSPVDFDAWSKAQLGFADVKRVFLDRNGEVIRPTATSGEVYRLWDSGGGSQEYFLLENRRRVGLDSKLPADGLLIWHVDERVPNNRNPNHYKVAVEQADGLYQLEKRYGSFSYGDAGDPFLPGREFGRDTDPSSFAYDGAESFVEVFNIHGPNAAGEYTADLHVEPGALVTVTNVQVTEIEGNGDGLLTAGELAGVRPTVSVKRRPATDLTLSLRSTDTLGEVVDTMWAFGSVPVNQVVAPDEPLRVRITGEAPVDPYGLRLSLEVRWANAPRKLLPVELAVGTVVGLSETFDAPTTSWEHAPLRITAVDQWIYGPTFGMGGTPGFKYGSVPYGFLGGADAALTSPPILLPPHAILEYQQALDVVFSDTTKVLAGGVIEVSANGGDWQPLVPVGGYPSYYGGSVVEWQGRALFAGRVNNGMPYAVRADLGSYRGAVRVRFRFHAAASSLIGAGWRVDNVRVLSDPTPVRVLSARAEVEDGDVRLSWELADPLPGYVRWRRGVTEGSAVPVSRWMAAAPTGQLIDPGAGALAPLRYWLDGLERDGTIETWGPVEAPPAQTALAWRVLENPSRGPARIAWSRPLARAASVEIFDVRGRRVRELPVPAGSSRLEWDGVGADGRPVPAGIYFARSRETGLAPIRLVRLP